MDNLIHDADVKIPTSANNGVQLEEPAALTLDDKIKNTAIPEDIDKPQVKRLYPETPPAAEQGWYKKISNINSPNDIPYRTLNNAAIYSMVAHNPLQKPEEIKKPTARPQPVITPTPMTNPMPQRTRMFAYNPYQRRGMY